ncbi:MAG: AAA family ATPase [Firmicutes bacterium]|nr:AAA family ATPase [Bacillota bacterium]
MNLDVQSLTLPVWAHKLREQYLAGVASQFLLHSNINDLVPYQQEYYPLRKFLGFLLGKKEILIFYNRSEGLTFAQPEMKDKFIRALNIALGPLNPYQNSLPHEPSKVFPLIELVFSIHSCGVVIDYVETIVPAGEVSYMSGEDRNNLVTLRRWASSPQLLNADSVVILITENMSDVHPSLRNVTSRMNILEIPFPGEPERLDYISWRMKKGSFVLEEISPERLAALTSGLNRVHLEDVFSRAAYQSGKITYDLVKESKKAIIENECSNLVEFVEPEHGFEIVGGCQAIKDILLKTAKSVREGRTRWVPMGILFDGPPGTGKTFLGEAFAKECGLNCLKLKNFREKWVGSTESNLEKILNVIKALAPVIVIVDEIDQSLGKRGGEGDSGTSNRIFAMLISFMGDTTHRGKIIFIGMCNRPDLLDEAFKRPGRFDLKIPFFYPDTKEEVLSLLKALVQKNGISLSGEFLEKFSKRLIGYSGAEIEAILLQSARYADDEGRSSIDEKDLEKGIGQFILNRDPMVRFMELISVKECSFRDLLPVRYQSLSPDQIEDQIQGLGF